MRFQHPTHQRLFSVDACANHLVELQKEEEEDKEEGEEDEEEREEEENWYVLTACLLQIVIRVFLLHVMCLFVF